ncbi:hypothetical protein ACG0Z6_11025 [Roseateles sp. BYS180W]|uniref:Uncharacterized protein n=1 Tax=Roseateles rivi TaxID=3299028 RepID=A0ABW7FWS2_9BURK
MKPSPKRNRHAGWALALVLLAWALAQLLPLPAPQQDSLAGASSASAVQPWAHPGQRR